MSTEEELPEPLTHAEKVDRLGEALSNLLDYYVDEYQLSLAEMIGTLEVEKAKRLDWAIQEEKEKRAGGVPYTDEQNKQMREELGLDDGPEFDLGIDPEFN